MRKITALRAGKGGGRRVNIFLDGKFAFSLEAEVVAAHELRVGQVLSADEIEVLTSSNRFHRCLSAAVQYLGYRPRSESELRDRLSRCGFDGEDVEAVIARLKGRGLVDDMAFAQFWQENRDSFSPRSRWLTGQELRRKGVADDVIDRVVGAVDDDDSAYRAALKRARVLPRSDYQSFRRRLCEYLRRRGFGYGVADKAVERVWQEGVGSSI